MSTKFTEFNKTIKPIHSFGFTPKYKEDLKINIKPRVFIEIAKEAFKKLKWKIVYESDVELVGVRENDFESATEKITITTNNGQIVNIKSETTGNGFWDFGRNSRRVKLFIFAYQEELKEFDSDKIQELEKETEAADNWDDYVIPTELPKPKKFRQPQIIIPVIGLSLLAILLGKIIAFLSMEGLYVIGLYELAVGLIFGFAIKLILPISNYTNWQNLRFVVMFGVFLTFFLNQYFQFLTLKEQYSDLTFSIFMNERLKYGLNIKDMNVGTIGLIVSWIFQLGFSYYLAFARSLKAILNFVIERVPQVVTEFAIYNFVKGKDERSVRIELSKFGWDKSFDQDMVFEAIGGVQGGQEWNRQV